MLDGLLRPLAAAGTWLEPGTTGPDRTRRTWPWSPAPGVAEGADLDAGALLGTVHGAGSVPHRVLVPPGAAGPVTALRAAGPVAATDPVAVVGGTPVPLLSSWPVRRARPVRERLDATVPLLTGQRVLDLLFPIARGSTAAVPGGFGTGKTVLLQQIAKWCDADVIVYVGCGERGNEMADVLGELAAIADPRTGGRLVDRTVIVANTSNMPMMAREASIYTAVTVAEYYRDMGYDAVVVADSTSRWAEALREFASRSGALPAEEGYPAGLASALAAFYERAGRVLTLGGEEGSVTIIGAVSPQGGDMTEPVTAHTQRFVRALWTLDRDLAYARHYPAVSWAGSFSLDGDTLAAWHARHADPAWSRRRARLASLLAEADRLAALADLMGVGALPGHERMVLLGARLVREGLLQQSALSRVDAVSGPERQRRWCPPCWTSPTPATRPSPGRPRGQRGGARPHPGAARPGDGVRRRRGGTARRGGGQGRRPGRWSSCGDRRPGRPRTEHTGADEVRGPLLVIRGVQGVGWDEFARIRLPSGEIRHGLVLEVDRDLAVVEVLEGTAGIERAGTRVSFDGSPAAGPGGRGVAGPHLRRPRQPGRRRPADPRHDHDAVAGGAPQPGRREPPSEPVLTGVGAIDTLTTLVRGQKLPVFSVAGLPHLELATQVAAQASAGGEPFCVVFAGMGLTHADAAAVRDVLEERSAAGELVLMLNTADAPVVERVLTPRIALTVAEHLAFTQGRHVLVVMADMTSYCEALREVSAARGEIPARRAYPGYLYSDLASLYERCGRIRGVPGSVTLLPVLTMPAGRHHPSGARPHRLHHRGADRPVAEAAARGIYPPVDPLSSLSRLMRKGRARAAPATDHLDVAAQLLAALARARQVRELAELVGADGPQRHRPALPPLRRRVHRRLRRPAARRAAQPAREPRRAWQVLPVLPAP